VVSFKEGRSSEVTISAVDSMPSVIRAYEWPKNPARILIAARGAFTATPTSGAVDRDVGKPVDPSSVCSTRPE